MSEDAPPIVTIANAIEAVLGPRDTFTVAESVKLLLIGFTVGRQPALLADPAALDRHVRAFLEPPA